MQVRFSKKFYFEQEIQSIIYCYQKDSWQKTFANTIIFILINLYM